MSFWTRERTARAVALARAGKSAEQICEIIRAPSRNAVIGKLYRMGISRQADATPDELRKIRRKRANEADRHWRCRRDTGSSPSA